MFPKLIVLFSMLLLIMGVPLNLDRNYHKDYYETGKLKSQGWLNAKGKTGYWKFYHGNGKKSEQGHYKKNLRENYWHFYDKKGK
ncbi:MAG: hypothetical protein AAFO99_11180, partial [Bacteroidota bacterium]